MITFFFALLLVVVLVVCWVLTLLGMPGNWLMVLAAAIHAYFIPAARHAHGALAWKVVVALAILAAVGECVELLAGALGVAHAGGSRRAAVLALLGSLVGALLGIVSGLPIPVVGSVVAAVLFAAFGAMAGAILGETWAGRDRDASWRVAKLAFWGRLAGTLSKVLLGAVMVAVVVVALVR
ncbi:MAG: DUF456 domain-containing protein [Thermoguttaceae bacterium]